MYYCFPDSNTIKNKGKILAIILLTTYNEKGINFFTPNEFSQQLAYMNHPSGYEIQPHVHNAIQREVHFTKEVLFIKSGKVRVDFYDDEKKYLESNILESGDVILLAFGGHGFVMMEDSEIIEVFKSSNQYGFEITILGNDKKYYQCESNF